MMRPELTEGAKRHTDRLRFLILVALMLLPGCASVKAGRSSGLVWYQPGKTAEETGRDLALCQHEAALQRQNIDYSGAPGTGALLDAWAQGKKEDDIIRRGMTAKGYSLVEKAKVEQLAR